jgi:hypothetical protein
VLAFIGATTQPALPHYDKAGKKDGFDGNDGVQERKRDGVKVRQIADPQSIYQDPGCEPCDVDTDKTQTSDEGAEQISDELRRCPARQKLFFVLGNYLDMVFQVICRSGHHAMITPPEVQRR